MSGTKRLLQYFSRYKTPLLLGGLCVIGSVVFSLAKPLLVGKAVNELTVEMSRTVLLRFALLIVVVAAIQGVFLFLHRRIIIGARLVF